ncbi:MAG: type II toxin-antitoxin system PrlF family antitoxin, partial [Chloroflexi bacterium]|nr:type II toxin-antitoxin system PrlF family antitoxin [Chloroflexota bacterium]
ITSKGQVTIPAEVRKHLGVKTHDKIVFVIEPEGTVELKAPRYRSIASLRGAAGSLKKPLSWSEMREISREERLDVYANTKLDFGDALIIASMQQAGSELLYSYDTDFDRIPGITRRSPGSIS